MKQYVFSLLALTAACQSPVTDVKDFIPGTYTRFTEGEYSKAWDTLVIAAYDKDQGTYVIQQHTGFQRILEGKLQPKEYKYTKALTVFDEHTKQLQDMKTGKLYTFSPDKGTVLAGSAEYVQVK